VIQYARFSESIFTGPALDYANCAYEAALKHDADLIYVYRRTGKIQKDPLRLFSIAASFFPPTVPAAVAILEHMLCLKLSGTIQDRGHLAFKRASSGQKLKSSRHFYEKYII
jgi:hypothetical protein